MKHKNKALLILSVILLCMVASTVQAQSPQYMLLYSRNNADFVLRAPDPAAPEQKAISALRDYPSIPAWSSRGALTMISAVGDVVVFDKVDPTTPWVLIPHETGRSFFNPVYSPDGLFLALDVLTPASNAAGYTMELVVYDLMRKAFVPVFNPAADRALQKYTTLGRMSWSPDGSRIAVEGQPSDIGPWDILLVTTNCLTESTLKTATPCTTSILPKPTPEGQRGSDYRFPAWSPDGTHIAFSCGGLCLLLPDQARDSVTKLETGDALVPQWSPDGLYISFTSGGNIHLWDVKNQRDIVLTDSNDVTSFAVWITLPEGNYLIAK